MNKPFLSLNFKVQTCPKSVCVGGGGGGGRGVAPPPPPYTTALCITNVQMRKMKEVNVLSTGYTCLSSPHKVATSLGQSLGQPSLPTCHLVLLQNSKISIATCQLCPCRREGRLTWTVCHNHTGCLPIWC